ncbi:hypothetical protein LTR28_010291 [Elasticomyces elasticus]|nr:hypothetical protein LTR28_010291 [Elasticomyces elasticus]
MSTDPVNPRSPDPEDDFFAARHRYLPWFLRTTFTLLWAIIAIVLLVAFLVVSFLPATSISSGFLPRVPVPVNRMGFSSTNFLYSFVPALLATLLLLFWLSIDLAFRRLQPFAALSAEGGALAEHSLLLSYSADLPIIVTVTAAANRHFRVAYLSAITLVAATLPVLAGGCLWAQFNIPDQRVRIYAHAPAFLALTVLVSVFGLSWLAAFAGRDRRLPHKARSLAQLASWLYQSRILSDAAFRAPTSKTDLVTRLLSVPAGERLSLIGGGGGGTGALADADGASKVSLADSLRGFARARAQARTGVKAGEVPRYGFGIAQGRDGRERLGVERMGRGDAPEVVLL